MVARGGSGADLVVLEVLGGGIAASNGTHTGTLSSHIDGQRIGVDREVGDNGGVAHGSDVEDSLGTKFRTGQVGPVHEVVTGVRGGLIVGVLEVLDGGGTAHTTHSSVVHIGSHVVHVGVEGGGVGSSCGQGHSARVLTVAILPLHEVVARGGSGADLVVLEVLGGGIAASNGTHTGTLSSHIDGQRIGVDREVGDNGGVAHGSDVEDSLGTKFRTGQVGPVHEVVTGVRGGLVVGVLEVLDGGGTAHATHSRVVHIGSHVVHKSVECGGEGGIFGQGHSARVVVVAILPLHEVVARGGSGADLVVQEVLGVGIAASDGTHASALSSHIDCQNVGVGVEVSHNVAVGLKLELVGVGGRNHSITLGPVHEVITSLRCCVEDNGRVVVYIGKGGGSAGNAAHGGGCCLGSHAHAGGNIVLRCHSNHEVVHIGCGAILAFSSQNDIVVTGHAEGQLVGVPAGGCFGRNYIVRDSVYTRDEGQLCGALNLAISAEIHSYTFVSLRRLTIIAVHIKYELVLIGGEGHLWQTQFGHSPIRHIGQL